MSMQDTLASSLSQEEIPVKLRCAICNKLVVNAFRLPCCDQSVCEHCQVALPESCPVCEHSPLAAEDCKPHKSLRLTVKAFLKNEEKKRDKGPRAVLESSHLFASQTTETVVPATPTDGEGSIGKDSVDSTVPLSHNIVPSIETDRKLLSSADPKEDLGDTAGQTAEVVDNSAQQWLEPRQSAQTGDVKTPSSGPDDNTVEDRNNDAESKDESGNMQQGALGHAYGNNLMNGMGPMAPFGVDWNSTGGFNSIMAMQNGLFPNIGMNSMGMDPMMMAQGMFGGFSGQGMGMNGMIGMNGMNMGNGFDGMYGWNGQPAMGMHGMNGDFGANTGYYPGGGYNRQTHQGHFNQMHQRFPSNNFQQNRSRGQGWVNRGYGRSQSFQTVQGINEDAQFTSQQNVMNEAEGRAENAHNEEQEPQEAKASKDGESTSYAKNEHDTETSRETETSEDQGGRDAQIPVEHSMPADPPQSEEASSLQPIATVDSSEPLDSDTVGPMKLNAPSGPAIPRGPAAYFSSQVPEFAKRGRGRGRVRGAFDLRGGLHGRGGAVADRPPIEPIGQGVAGAPTGPKAMRNGLPNVAIRGMTGIHGTGRGVGRVQAEVGKPATQSSSKTERARSFSKSQSRSRSRTRSATQHRRHRSRSRGLSDEPDSRVSSRQRHRSGRHSRKHDHDDEVHEEKQYGARDSSPDSRSKRPSRRHRDRHRSYRERSRDQHHRKHRSRSSVEAEDDDMKGLNVGRSSHRSRREAKHHHRDIDKDDNRSRRDRPPSRKDEPEPRNGHSSRQPRSISGEIEKTAAREFKIKDRSKRTELDIQKEIIMEEKPDIDPHALEREARNRERQLKEEQRRHSLYGEPGKKRSRLPDHEAENDNADLDRRSSSRRKLTHEGEQSKLTRRVSYKYEDEENDEARALRVENEREAARWV